MSRFLINHINKIRHNCSLTVFMIIKLTLITKETDIPKSNIYLDELKIFFWEYLIDTTTI